MEFQLRPIVHAIGILYGLIELKPMSRCAPHLQGEK